MANLAPLAGSELPRWPGWLKGLVSAALLWQILSLIMAELAQSPSSPLERRVAEVFGPYYEWTGQGNSHQFYSDIEPTPILLAELRFADGRPNRTVRLPDRSVRPRIVYQRQLALAHWVTQQADMARAHGVATADLPAVQAIAHYLCRREPGCSGVTLRWQRHHNPEPEPMIHAALRGKPLDPEAEEFYDVPALLGDFPCPTP